MNASVVHSFWIYRIDKGFEEKKDDLKEAFAALESF